MHKISLKEIKTRLPEHIKIKDKWLGVSDEVLLTCTKCHHKFKTQGKHINKDLKCPICEKDIIIKEHIKKVMQRYHKEVIEEEDNVICIDGVKVDLSDFTLSNYQIKTIKLITESMPLFSS